MHKQLRHRFPRNPYTVNNILDVWECDLIDVQSLSKFNGNFKYLLTVIDVFSKFLHNISPKIKDRPHRNISLSIDSQRPEIFYTFTKTTTYLGADRQR